MAMPHLSRARINVWAIENIFYYVPSFKFAGGNLGFMVGISNAGEWRSPSIASYAARLR